MVKEEEQENGFLLLQPNSKVRMAKATVYNFLDRLAMGFPAEISTAPSLSLPSLLLELTLSPLRTLVTMLQSWSLYQGEVILHCGYREQK